MISYIYYIVVNNGMLTMSTAKPVVFPRTIHSMSAVFFRSAKLVHYLEDHPRTDDPVAS